MQSRPNLKVVFNGKPHYCANRFLLHRIAAKCFFLQNGYTPLHICAQNGTVKVATVLAAYGSDFNAKANDGDTPLHVASKFGNINIVHLLLDYYGNTNTQVCNVTYVKNFSYFFVIADRFVHLKFSVEFDKIV